jgi:tetratricopeptide (TPR) repeat protein
MRREPASGAALACALSLALAAALAAPAAAKIDEAEWLLESASPDDAERAAKLLEARAAETPDRFEARFGAARALTQVMAIRTNGNLPLVDGLQDDDANRALWADLGARALAHARAAHALRPESVEAAAALASSYMFYASSLGIIRSIVSGAGGEYRTHAQRVVDLDAKFDDAVGHALLASFYLVAPWPVGDRDQSLAHFERAAALAPGSVRNQYGLGVFWARDGDAARARPHFERARALPCTPHTERLFCDWMKQTSAEALAALGTD